MRNVISKCAKDTDFSYKKPYDTDGENFKYFALCLRSNVAINPILNQSHGVRKNVLNWDF